MTPQRVLIAAVLLVVAADAVHWFIGGSAHSDAGAIRRILVALQAVVGLGGAAWLLLRSRARQRETRVTPDGPR
jgi:hypothetical protein